MPTTGNDGPNRWWITTATFLVMFPIGGIYAWSVFVEPLQEQFEWGGPSPWPPLMVNVAFIFVGTLVGGKIQDRTGPRWVAVTGTLVYCAGVALASLARTPEQFWLLVLTYGVMGGTGVGVAYICCPAMIVKWFPTSGGWPPASPRWGSGPGPCSPHPSASGRSRCSGPSRRCSGCSP